MFRIGGYAKFSVFRYQHVGILNAKFSHWGSKPTSGPNVNDFALQWNIGFIVCGLTKREVNSTVILCLSILNYIACPSRLYPVAVVRDGLL